MVKNSTLSDPPGESCDRDSLPERDSGILMPVRRRLISLLFIAILAGVSPFLALGQTAPLAAAASASAKQLAPQALAPGQANAPLHSGLSVVVLDPSHGGTDQGARGSTGITESDVVLGFARLVRISLEGQGLRAVLTRQANEGPSFDDRSKIANGQRGVIFISLHISSTGQPGTVRVYSLSSDTSPIVPRSGLIPWDHAQSGYLDSSRRLAELIQIQMAQRFHGSPETPLVARVRQLRTVAAPAVAIEVSSVSLPDRGLLDQMGPPFADAVARAVAAFRVVSESEGK
jgi:N-acetylmuramoyl-L-alanine amidase